MSKTVKRNYKTNRFIWTEWSENLLIEMWEDRIRGCRKNRLIHEEMASELQRMGCSVAATEVNYKIKHLSNRYRKEKAKIGVSSGSPSEWIHYTKVHKIVGGFKINNISVEETLDIEIFDSPTSTSLSSPSPSPSPSSTSSSATTLIGLRESKNSRSYDNIITKIDELDLKIDKYFKNLLESEDRFFKLEQEKTKIEAEKLNILKRIAERHEEVLSKVLKFLDK